ncbi:MAG: cadherin-like domain-containing protein [Pirellulales bacterium]
MFKDRGATDRSDFQSLTASILQPQDNDSANVDVDRNVTTIRVTSGTMEYFSVLLVDGEGIGPDASTVTAQSILVTENGHRLTPGVDYVFAYNANSRTIRLTPLAGIWRKDSIYEITLNNRTTYDVTLKSGTNTVDGDTVRVVTAAGTTTLTFRRNPTGAFDVPFSNTDSAYQIATRLVAKINAVGSGVRAYLEGDGTVGVIGANSLSVAGTSATFATISRIQDIAGNALAPNRSNSLTQFTIVMPDVTQDYGDNVSASTTLQINDGARNALLPIDITYLALGNLVDADADGSVTNSATGDDNESLVSLGSFGVAGAKFSTAGPAVLTMPAGNTVGLDGQKVVITDNQLKQITVEFDLDGNTTSGNVVVNVLAGDSAAQVATKFAAAVKVALLAGKIGLVIPIASGADVSLGGSPSHVFDLTSAPSVVRAGVGNVGMTMPTILTGLDGKTFTVNDGNGNSVTFEIDDTANAGVAGSNVPIVIGLSTATGANLAQAISNAINAQVTAGKLKMGATTVSGSTVQFFLNDDDGVSFGTLFNSKANPVPVTINATAPGMLDAWIDWNGDGVFDSSERMSRYIAGTTANPVSTSLPLSAGANTFLIQTPASAVVGFTTARFRISTLGNLEPSSVGIGGETEDYMIEVVAGTPPVAVADTYTTLEDPLDPTDPSAPLVVAAPGVLANDTDAENDALTVYDPNPATPTVEPVVAPTNGTLTLNRDGSFSYMPNLDFYGTDTFVYYVTDPRLISNTPTTVTITINPVNDAPKAFDDSTTILEDAVTTIAGSTLWTNDWKHLRNNANENAQTLSLLSARILGPADGVTQGSTGGSVTVNTTTDTLTYTPPADYNNAINGAVLIEVTIIDNGAAGASTNRKTAKSTLTVSLTPVNDRPLFTMPATTATVEDAGAVTVSTFITNPQPGPATALDEGPGPALVPESQTMTYQVRALDTTLFSVQPAISATGTLTYTLAPDVNRIQPGPGQPGFPQILVEVIAKDSGSAVAPNLNLSLPQTFTILPTEVNDKPEITVPTTANSIEDQGLVTVPGFATGIRRGPTTALDETNQSLTASFTYDPTAFTTPPAINLVNGDLTYQTAPNVNSATGQSLVVVMTLTDGGPFAVPAQSIQKTFTLSVTPVNDAPVFTIPSTTATTEDAGAVTVANFATNIAPGPTAARWTKDRAERTNKYRSRFAP